MTLQQKLQSDLVNEQLALESARREADVAMAAVREHEIRLAYIKECLGDHNTEKSPPKEKVRTESANGHEIDIDQAMQQAFRQAQGRLRAGTIVERVMALGYGSADVERVRKNVSSFLQRKSKNPEKTGYRKVGRGLFEYHAPTEG